MQTLRPIMLASGLLAVVLSLNSSVWACPLCGPATPSLAEQISSFESVVLVKFISNEKPDRNRDFSGTTRFEIVEIVKDESKTFQKKMAISLNRYRHAAPGSLVLFMGNQTEGTVKWSTLLNMTPASFKYLREAPGLDVPSTQRLAYYIKFLEHSDPVIAADAFSEFAIAPYNEIAPLKNLMPPKRLREWLANPKEPADRFVRLGLYGLMLGLSGTEQDADFLKSLVLNSTEDYQFGIDGMIAGYLILTGEEGLTVLEKELLSNPEVDRLRIFPVMQALRFVWSFEGDRFSKQKLRDAMRVLIKRPELADLVIIDLARWKDWDAMDEIVSLYGQADYNVPAIKRAILRYLLTAEKSSPRHTESGNSSHIAKAQGYLKQIRQKDPRTYQAAARYFFE